MMTITHKQMALVAKFGVSIAVLWYLFAVANVDAFLSRIASLPPVFVALAWGYYAFCQWLSAYRWQLILATEGIHLTLYRLFSFYMVGMFMNNFLPGAVGGDMVKSYDLYRATGKGSHAVASVFLERFTGLVGLAAIAVLAALVSVGRVHSMLIWIAVLGTVALLVLVIVAIWSPRIARIVFGLLHRILPAGFAQRLRALHEVLLAYRKHKKTLWLAVFLSAIIQILFAIYYALTASVLGIDVSVLYFILFLPIVSITTMVPISFGGLGIREAVMAILFAEVGVTTADVLSISLTVFVINAILSLWGGVILLSRTTVRKA